MLTLFFSKRIYEYVQNRSDIKEKERTFLFLDGIFHAVCLTLLLLFVVIFLQTANLQNVVIVVILSIIIAIILALLDKKILFKKP